MANRIELTTVTISVREERNYVPPQTPTFLVRITKAWAGSLEALIGFGKNATVAVVAVFPWLLVFSVTLCVPVTVARKRIRRGRKQHVDSAS